METFTTKLIRFQSQTKYYWFGALCLLLLLLLNSARKPANQVKLETVEDLKGLNEDIRNSFLVELAKLKELKVHNKSIYLSNRNLTLDGFVNIVHLQSEGITMDLLSTLDSREHIRNDLIERLILDLASTESNLFDKKMRSLEIIFQLRPELIESKIGESKGTPLQLAATEKFKNGKQLELIKMLIDNKANVNAQDYNNNTVLHWAVLCKASTDEVISLIKLLIESGAEPNSVNEWGQTFAHVAPSITTPEVFQEIVRYLDSIKNTKSFTIRDIQGAQVLHLAVFYYEKLENQTLEIFQSNGVDFNAKQDNNRNVLECAIGRTQDVDFLKTLIAFGADWKIKDEAGGNILHWAAFNGNFPAFKLFKSFGINVNAVQDKGRSGLSYAIMNGQNSTFIEKVIGLGANWRMINTEVNETGLHWAAASNNLSALKLFISFGANVNAETSYGDTPLHYAFFHASRIGENSFDLVKQLIEDGANPNIKNGNGDLPSDLAKNKIENEQLKQRVVNLLLSSMER
ncbi:unnamed protein product [Orchesella dallaii]|uniref:Ankyrin repeat protein n=1 Tax=Orchesella dallaii TaxID=48710 RepID=A0ABP1S4X0_9HEXA